MKFGIFQKVIAKSVYDEYEMIYRQFRTHYDIPPAKIIKRTITYTVQHRITGRTRRFVEYQ